MAQALTRSPTGEVQLQCYEIEALKPSTVLVRFLAAPVNPLDLLVLAGSYPVKPANGYRAHGILGYDGFAEVVKCSEVVIELQPGDVVVPSKFGVVLKVSVQPAYLLIEDMTRRRTGDWIIQNAATSAVAQMVVQFARLRGLQSISVVRNQESASTAYIKQSLTDLGAEKVLTEKELSEQSVHLKTKPIMLAIDSVFDALGRLLVDCLATGSTFVQLGFLSSAEERLQLRSEYVFVRHSTLRGLRDSAQIAQRTFSEQCSLLECLVQLFIAGTLALGVNMLQWHVPDEAKENEVRLLMAIDRAKKDVMGQRKQMFVFTSATSSF